IDVTTPEILRFQCDAGSDVGTPVDIPTPPDASRERAERELDTTQERLAIAESVDIGSMLVSAPVQGSTYPDLRERAAAHAYETDLDVFPVGAVVPLMNAYRYDDMIDVLAGAKRGLGADAPVHLFGAGHPMMFALAVAMGADIFDSAAYAIYARDDRYLTVSGTEQLDDLTYFPCSCPVCSTTNPEAVRTLDDQQRESVLAEHNLWVSMEEIRRVKGAISEGSLLELVERRARGHPSMLDGYRRLLAHEDQLEASDPVSKDVFMALSPESARRPEVARYHDRLARFDPQGTVLLTEGSGDGDYDESWRLIPPFGPVPSALSQTYPLTAETPERSDTAGYEAAAEGVSRLAEANPNTSFTVAHVSWPASALERLPSGVERIDLRSGPRRTDDPEDNSDGETEGET
ncbi:MAG: tRNA guanosine(15) transglycosylase TgtA, partial [Halanaeroarchaeum sp.]